MESQTIDKLKKAKQLPSRIDWISGNPVSERKEYDNSDPRKREDYHKTIYEIKSNLKVVKGTITKTTRGTYQYSGLFKNSKGEYVPPKQLTADEKKTIEADFKQEVSNLKNQYPNELAMQVLPPKHPDNALGCDNDVDKDGIQNGWDNCSYTYNPNQKDSLGNGIGDACRKVLICDADHDGVIDKYDISAILSARDLPAANFGGPDPRDADGDGMITANDARICALRCTYSGCESQSNEVPQ